MSFLCLFWFFFFKQKTAYEMRISDWSSDVCSSDLEEISGGHDLMTIGKHELQTRAYVGAFNFKGGDQQKKVGQLSGGERNRVHMAKLLKEGGNVLLDRKNTRLNSSH